MLQLSKSMHVISIADKMVSLSTFVFCCVVNLKDRSFHLDLRTLDLDLDLDEDFDLFLLSDLERRLLFFFFFSYAFIRYISIEMNLVR